MTKTIESKIEEMQKLINDIITIDACSYSDCTIEAKGYRLIDISEELKSLLQEDKGKGSIKIEDFHIGFEYEEYEHDGERYLSQGFIWKKKVYGLESPRLYKMQKSIEAGEVRHLAQKIEEQG